MLENYTNHVRGRAKKALATIINSIDKQVYGKLSNILFESPELELSDLIVVMVRLECLAKEVKGVPIVNKQFDHDYIEWLFS